MNSMAAEAAVHAPSASATSSGLPAEAAVSTPGSACTVTAFTEIRLNSAAYRLIRCHLCSPLHGDSGMYGAAGGGGGGDGAIASSRGPVR